MNSTSAVWKFQRELFDTNAILQLQYVAVSSLDDVTFLTEKL